MAPTRSKKRKSTESNASVEVQIWPAPPQLVATKARSPARTPTNKTPIRKQKMGITLGQKQALIDNLQLEITERARKLRAKYAILAQGLRTRIEFRVNRIPMALRRANMGELLLKYSENNAKSAPKTSPAKTRSPAKNLMQQEQANSRASPSPQRGTKRMSEEIAMDQENEDIENPRKRIRGPPAPPERTTSRAKLQPSQVLSPRSANSRALPVSPVRPANSPGKSYLARPLSPLKPKVPTPPGGAAGILTNMVEKAKTTRGTAASRKIAEAAATGGAGRGKRTAAPAPPPKNGRGRAESGSSDGSTSTIVRKPVAAAKKAAPAKKTVMSTIKAMGATKKAPAPKASAPAGGRVLRKRN